MFISMQVEWYIGLVLVINVDVDCYESFCIVVFVCVFFFQIFWYFFVLGEVCSILFVYGFFVYVGVVDVVQRFQYFYFFIVDVVCVQVRWWRYCNYVKNLQQVVLDYVVYLIGFIKIVLVFFDFYFFCYGNFNMINGVIVLVIYKQGVSKMQC